MNNTRAAVRGSRGLLLILLVCALIALTTHGDLESGRETDATTEGARR